VAQRCFDLSRIEIVETPVQPRGHHSQGAARRSGFAGRICAQESRAAEGSQTTLEQIFLSIVGQEGAERPQLEELSWLM